MKISKLTTVTAMTVLFSASAAFSHCQIPCGIYGDQTRFDLMKEHVQTMEKSMNELEKLSKQKEPNYNQLVRWVENKGEHAAKFTEIVTYYFMAQRVNPVTDKKDKGYDKYVRQVELLHQMVVQAMKVKQTTDQKHIDGLRKLIGEFEKLYMGDKAHDHDH